MGAANATSSAETAKGALAQAQSTALGSSGAAQSTAKTSLAGVSVQSSAIAPTGGNRATTNAITQGGAEQAFVNPGQAAYAFSTALPDKAYSATLIDGASNVAGALLGPRDAVSGPLFWGRITPPTAAAIVLVAHAGERGATAQSLERLDADRDPDHAVRPEASGCSSSAAELCERSIDRPTERSQLVEANLNKERFVTASAASVEWDKPPNVRVSPDCGSWTIFDKHGMSPRARLLEQSEPA
jgi:hypothetical protein